MMDPVMLVLLFSFYCQFLTDLSTLKCPVSTLDQGFIYGNQELQWNLELLNIWIKPFAL
jgi:hypothetical protein